jgi:RimJ/RimL family protein N-acetyltransferase
MPEFRLETDRLILRSWREEDRAPFHAMSTDPKVMATLGPLMSRAESDALIDRMRHRQDAHGHTCWAVERKHDALFIGWCGIVIAPDGVPIAGLPEIGWRLAHHAWGQGYAKEGAQAALAWGFDQNGMDRIWAFTAENNNRSWGLMERLGMTRHYDMDFEHPNVAENSPLKSHITYSIGNDQWAKHK